MANDVADLGDASLWGPSLEKIFIDIMVDEVNKGNMADGQFSTTTWTKILEALQAKTNRKYSKQQIKQKFNRLRIKYREFSDLLKQTGFGWDRETNTVTASEEVWQNYIRVHPNASQYRKKGCDRYMLLELIFNKSTATGFFRRSASSGPPNTDDENELENDDRDTTSVASDRLVDEISNHSTKPSTTSAERRAKKRRSQQMSDALLSWTEAAKVRTEASLAKVEKYKNRLSGEGSGQKEEFSLTNCVKIIEGMEGIDDDIYMKAIKMFKDPDWREIFVNMSNTRKRAWLDRL